MHMDRVTSSIRKITLTKSTENGHWTQTQPNLDPTRDSETIIHPTVAAYPIDPWEVRALGQ
jgi:hypothetical protein